MVALQYHLKFVVDMQRLLGILRQFSLWHGQMGMQNIFRRAIKWETQVKELPWESILDAYTILDKTELDKGPTHYRLRTTLPTLYELELTRTRLYLALQGSCHTEFRLKLCAAIKQREEARFKGRTRSFLRSVLGEFNTGVYLDHLYVNEDTLLNQNQH
jgi:hypothetical protein